MTNARASGLRVQPVTTERDRRVLVRFPWRIYRNDPRWVPPLIHQQERQLDPERGSFFGHGEAAPFVARRGDRKVRMLRFTGSLEDLIRGARWAGTKLLGCEEVHAPPDVAELLGVRAGSPLTLITRLRLIGGSPSILARNYMRNEWARCLDPGKVDWDRTLLELVERGAGVTIDIGRQTIQAETADATVAALLQVPVGFPVLQVRRLDISRKHGPIQYVISDVRADRYIYSVDLVRHREGGKGFWRHSQRPIHRRKTR